MPLRHGGMLAEFTLLFVLWLLFSERTQARYLALGAASAALVVWWNRAAGLRPVLGPASGLRAGRFLFRYLPWLVGQIILANLQVTVAILHPRLPIRPAIIEVPTNLQHDLALAVLGNSITLTPGTLTVDIEGPTLIVHALTPDSAQVLYTHELPNRVADLFGHPPMDHEVQVRHRFPAPRAEGSS